MMKISLLLISLLTLALMTSDVPAFGGDQTLICYFHETVYDIQFVEDGQQSPSVQCGLPSQQLVDDTPAHDAHKRLDVHDPECFSWIYMTAQ